MPARRINAFVYSIAVIAANLVLISCALAEGKCDLGKLGEVPIAMEGLRPYLTAQVNGKDAKFLLDSGAFYSLMSTAEAGDLGLKLTVSNMNVSGVGGKTRSWMTKVQDFAFLGTTFHDVQFLVTGSELGSTGLIGENLLAHFDAEYDLGKGAIRLYKPEGCGRTYLAYWAAGQASLMDIEAMDSFNGHIIGVAYVNGKKIRAMFDTGATTSVLTLTAANNVGIDIKAPGVKEAGYSYGIGRAMLKSYIVPVASFKVGDDEEIKNTRIRVADFRMGDADMLVGADFFLSHRVFVSNSQHKLYLTYSGGPVFNLANATAPPQPTAPQGQSGQAPSAEASPAETAPAEAPHAEATHAEASPGEAQPAQAQPAAQTSAAADVATDAAEYARLGSALVSRHEFERALADFSKAVEMEPGASAYVYERAKLYFQTGQLPLALADLDRVIALKPDYIEAYISRAAIRERQDKMADAVADLDAAAALAPPRGDIRLGLAQLYAGAQSYAAAIKQSDLWIESHPVDARFAVALSERCYWKALQNQDLSGGLSDCNRVLALVDMRKPDNATTWANRGMVRLRQGAYDKAESDFDSTLKLQPKNVRGLYGRGVARIHLNKQKEGEADIDAAVKLSPKTKEFYQAHGIGP
jgi:predicted aspartyl protease/Tfp pilus assembly protein PilF